MTRKEASDSVRSRPSWNGLDGRRWLQNSISVWSDIRKSAEEARLGHPAMFPAMLVERLIETFLPTSGEVVLDPFAGSGSTLVAAERMGKTGIGLELSAEYVALARSRLQAVVGTADDGPSDVRPPHPETERTSPARQVRSVVYQASATDLLRWVKPDSVDLCLTSPPYWNILNQRRTADGKQIRHYGNHQGDLATIADYETFLDALAGVFADVLRCLKPKCYCLIVVMDLRKKNRFYPLHADLARKLEQVGYIFDDLIIWNRQAEYNNLRPLGYPTVFRINKVHEFILILRRPG